MESLDVIARPHFAKADLAWLTDIWSRRAGSRAAPYFTLVFSVIDIEPDDFTNTIRIHANGGQHFRFRSRSALVTAGRRGCT